MKSWHDECGVFGIWNHPEASRLTYLGLYAIQHRGQESAGIVSLDTTDVGVSGIPEHIHHKGLGLVADVFDEDSLNRLKGRHSIGHVRYSTTGQNYLTNAQPLTAKLLNGPIAIAHNGNIVNAESLRNELKRLGAIFQGTNDTEVLLHLIAHHKSAVIEECLKEELVKLQGAYSFTLLTHDKMIAARDIQGFRPLVLGKINLDDGGESFCVASETCAFDLIGAEFVREIEPGEILIVDDSGMTSQRLDSKSNRTAQCVFEHVYFARPDSKVFGRSVYQSRKEFGRMLARENRVEADIVIPVPDSGVPSALGYSEESGIPFELGIIRNHYVGRTFIEPKQSIRSFGVKIKLNPQQEVLQGKRVVVIDDSLVRGTTSKKIIQLVRQYGAKEVHLRIAAPPTVGPCFYGVDTPSKSELIASHNSVSEICEFVGADSLSYLSMEGLAQVFGGGGSCRDSGYCAACFGEDYPTELFGLDLKSSKGDN